MLIVVSCQTYVRIFSEYRCRCQACVNMYVYVFNDHSPSIPSHISSAPSPCSGTSVMTSATTSDHVTRPGLELYYLIKTPEPVFGSALSFDLPPVSSHQDQILRLHDISLPATIHTTCTAIQTYHINTYLDTSNYIHIQTPGRQTFHTSLRPVVPGQHLLPFSTPVLVGQ
jgi:hypothetical protein